MAAPAPAPAAPPRVVILLRSLEIGGAERQAVLLAKALHQAGWPVSVVTSYDKGELAEELRAAGVDLHLAGKKGRWDMLGFLARLTKLLRDLKPDIIHSYLDVSNLTGVLLRPFLPKVKLVWGVRASFMDLSRYGLFPRLVHEAARLASRRADLIIINSMAGRKLYAGLGYPAQRMRVIPNGVDTQRFYPQPGAGDGLRREWGVAPDEPLAGLVGRIDPMKDHGLFLEAGALALAQRPGLRLVCVGGGDPALLEGLKARARELSLEERLIWAGPRTDMHEVYNALNLLVSSSRGEGFSNVIAEAMACGTPCAATRVGDSAYLLDHPQYMAPPGDAPALARAMLRALSLEAAQAQELGRALRSRILEHFSLERLLERTQELLLNQVTP